MEDDHVDRPGVQAQQCVELTGTNRSSGLIVLMTHARHETIRNKPVFACLVLRRPGGPCEEPKPDPIPNSAVKLLSADGTLSQDMGE